MSKHGLGKGLEALLGDNSDFGQGEIQELELSLIEGNPDQPRRDFDAEGLQELADSLKQHGLLQPILVNPVGDGYKIIAGERRFRAAKLAGFTRIKCIVQSCDELEMTEKALVENIQRSNLSPVEEGLAYARLIKEYNLTQEEVARQVGKGRATVANLLRIIQLPKAVLDLVQKGEISLGHAKVLLSLADASVQVLAAQKIAQDKLSVRETEELLARLTKEKETQKVKKAQPVSVEMRTIEEKLRQSFQTKVKIKGGRTRGKIEIDFFSAEELSRLLEFWHVEIE